MCKVVFAGREGEVCFEGLRGEVTARSPEEVIGALEAVEAGVGDGLHAAGYVAYEAASAFDRALRVHGGDGAPLVWFGLYERRVRCGAGKSVAGGFEVGEWEAECKRDEYDRAIRAIRAYIEAGDVYQINYTFGMNADFSGDASGWFRALCRAQGGSYGAYVDTGRHQIVSASPELFFRLDGDMLETRPMKGTRPRGSDAAEDMRLRDDLFASEKDRAENVMVVDLLRNDMGRISLSGSVEVTDLFCVEPYRTVWQMTTGIRSRTGHSVPQIFAALFPSGSVTGAPKVRAMEIIHELERRARGAYCGAVGRWSPGRQAQFNVAIRTAVVDRAVNRARYCVGGGITWDSTAGDEYEECRAKAAILSMAGSS